MRSGRDSETPTFWSVTRCSMPSDDVQLVDDLQARIVAVQGTRLRRAAAPGRRRSRVRYSRSAYDLDPARREPDSTPPCGGRIRSDDAWPDVESDWPRPAPRRTRRPTNSLGDAPAPTASVSLSVGPRDRLTSAVRTPGANAPRTIVPLKRPQLETAHLRPDTTSG